MMQYEKPEMELIELASANADVIKTSALEEVTTDPSEGFDF